MNIPTIVLGLLAWWIAALPVGVALGKLLRGRGAETRDPLVGCVDVIVWRGELWAELVPGVWPLGTLALIDGAVCVAVGRQ